MPTRLGGHVWRPCVWLCKGQCCRHCHKTYKQKLGFMYGLMVVVERLGHVGISTHTAGKSNTKEDLPRKFLLPQKVQHNLTDLINLCCDTSGPEEKYITETETKKGKHIHAHTAWRTWLETMCVAMYGTVLQALSLNIQAKNRLHVWPNGGC